MTSCTAQIFVKSKEKQHHAAQILQIFDKGGAWVTERAGSTGKGNLWKMCRDGKANSEHERPFAHSVVGNKEQKSHQAVPGTGVRSQLRSQGVLRGENAWEPSEHLHPCPQRTPYVAFSCEGKAMPMQSLMCAGDGAARSPRGCWYGRFNRANTQMSSGRWRWSTLNLVDQTHHTCACFDLQWACRKSATCHVILLMKTQAS